MGIDYLALLYSWKPGYFYSALSLGSVELGERMIRELDKPFGGGGECAKYARSSANSKSVPPRVKCAMRNHTVEMCLC